MALNFKYIPLTFLKDEEQIVQQIKNTIILKYFFEKNKNITKLSALIEGTQYGYNASALESGKNKFLRISDITDGKVDWDSVPFCDCSDELTYLLYPNDLLIARTGGTTGKSFIITNPPKSAIYAGYLIRIRANEDNDANFINLFLNSYAYWSQVVSLNKGEFRPSVNAKKIKELILPVCSLDEQSDAVRISKGEQISGYSDLYNSIENTLKAYYVCNQIHKEFDGQKITIGKLKQSILQEAIEGKLTKEWREANPNVEPASVLLERIQTEKAQLVKEKKIKKQKPLPAIEDNEKPFELPEGWVWCRLGDLLLQTFYGPRFSNSDYVDEGIPTIRTTDMDNGVIVLKTPPKVKVDDAKKIELYKLLYNDLLITRTGSIGTMALFKDNYLAIPSAYLIRCRFMNIDFADYTFNALQTNYALSYFGLNTKTGTRPNINAVSITNLAIPLPPIKEQHIIVQKIKALSKEIERLKKQVQQSLEDADLLMQVVLQEAFEVKENELV